MEIIPQHIKGLFVIKPRRFGDHRGFFAETWNKKKFSEQGLELPDFVQDNHSLSGEVGTVRGLHFQSPPLEQGKLVRCGKGKIYDVVVDIRNASETYGAWFGVELSFENGLELWVPPGFLHGFVTLEPGSEIVYKCTNYYSPQHEGIVRWDSCGIEWPQFNSAPVLSERDANAVLFKDFVSPFN